MAYVGTVLQELLKINKRIRKRIVKYDERLQDKTLRKLLSRAKNTRFGKKYGFKDILLCDNVREEFRKRVPVYDYDKLYNEFWVHTLKGRRNITWPGKMKFFALTSGTSGSASKRVPVSLRQIKAVRKASVRQMLTIPDFKFSPDFYEKSVLMVGGTTDLKRIPTGYEGDLSGILQRNIPKWFDRFYKPGKKIASIRDWNEKLDAMAKEAHKWDIGIICGVPAWIQMLFERILAHHQVKNIHEIWPNLNVYIHGGVAFTPYRESFKKYLGKEIQYLDTYLASEGFLALQTAENKQGMQLILDNWIYYEFVPFTEENFDVDGNLKKDAKILILEETETDKDYAILISTCSGAWRYLIGDTIRFKDKSTFEIIISGRTKHFLSLCGEHLSVDNMNMGIRMASEELDVRVNEFTVAGEPYEGSFRHHWYIGVDREINSELFKKKLDEALCVLNDDYATERKHALKDLIVEQVPIAKFYAYLESKGKIGGQNKFPRVIKNSQYEDWKQFLSKH
ncbi:MAG: GH3 auxin-responsive promoter family protein [Flavobacteriales bacterium]|nr:GH3 auxin-responsive promoter family protein [Flavobacteriales bacterium]